MDVFVNEQRAPFAEIDETDALPGTQHIQAFVHPGSGPDFPWGTADPGSPLRLVGTARVFGPPEEQHIGRVCVAQDMRTQGSRTKCVKPSFLIEPVEVAGQDALAHWGWGTLRTGRPR